MPPRLSLSDPPDYFPLAHGRYDVAAGLMPLDDKPHFQIDRTYLAYMAAKVEARRENAAKYHVVADFAPGLHRAIARFAADKLAERHADAFAFDGDRFTNRLLGLSARLDWEVLRVRDVTRETALLPGGEAVYAEFDLEGAGLVDFLALQTQEDWAVTAVDPGTDAERLRMLHLSFPNHWSPAEKIGRPFAAVHAPVAGIGALVKAAPHLIEAMIRKGPWERFAWDVATDTVLNHHPDNPDDPARQLSDFTPEAAGAGTCLRIERQALQGFPEQHGALFLIRTYFSPVASLSAERKRALARAVRGMSDASLAYKGLVELAPPLVAYLESSAG